MTIAPYSLIIKYGKLYSTHNSVCVRPSITTTQPPTLSKITHRPHTPRVTYVTGFTKINQLVTITELEPNINDTFMHCSVVSTTWLKIARSAFRDGFFSNPVKLCWCTTGPVGPLRSTNQNWWGAKPMPEAVLIYPVVCLHICHLLEPQHHCLCPNGRENLP